MICIILVAGHGTLLENEIKVHPDYGHLVGVPKGLLPGVGGKRILDYWWAVINSRQLFRAVYLVTNADKYKHYERWATASDFPVENIINDGTTTLENRLGAVSDFDLALRTKNIQDDVLVVAGDMLFQDSKFDISQVLNYFRLKNDGDLAIYYEMEVSEKTESRGIVEVSHGVNRRHVIDMDGSQNRIVKFYEKPKPDETASRLASVVFYCLRKTSLPLVAEYLSLHPHVSQRNFGKFMEWIINIKQHRLYGMKLPTGFQLIGHVGLADYMKWLDFFADQAQIELRQKPISKRAYARIGLSGNPSDGFFGKTISLSIKNFWADVVIMESKNLVLTPHPLHDPTEFGSLADLHGISRREGYLGGLRLLQATCKKFYQYCSQRGIALAKRNFTLKYDTNIPRQVGLAGSSAIVVATLKCLMEFFNLTDADMPIEEQPLFVLEVEKEELFIQAGLQDRVIQIYEGLVYMDFSKSIMEEKGYGLYENMDIVNFPPVWLAYLSDPSDSGKIHSDISIRWQNGDVEVMEGMKKFAHIAAQAREAIINQDWKLLGELMNANFELRRKLYGDDVLGTSNLRMIEIARLHGSVVKFPGSGGAVIGLCEDPLKMEELKKAFQTEGFVFCEVIPNKPV